MNTAVHDRLREEEIALEVTRVIPPAPPISEIAEVASRATGVTVEDILGDSKIHRISHVRQYVMWRARKEGFSLPAIARVMRRDHTTIIHGIEAVNKRMEAAQ
jgi:chromosomal replication initiation ATPase DnaA